MNRFKLIKNIITLSCALFCNVSYSSITLSHKLTCKFNDDEIFDLKVKYEMSLYPLPIIHGSRFKYGNDWELIKTGRFKANSVIHVSFSGTTLYALKLVCLEFGKFDENVSYNRYILDNNLNSADFKDSNLDYSHFVMYNWEQNKNHKMIKSFNDKNLFTSVDVYIKKIKNTIIVEQGLLAPQKTPIQLARYVMPILYVNQTISHDDGKTWSPQEITKNALIFEIGKSQIEQNFIAKPYKFNNKLIPPDIDELTILD